MSKRKNLPRDLKREVANLQKLGVTLPRNAQARRVAASDYNEMVNSPGALQQDVSAYFDRKATPEVQSLQKNAEVISAMRRHRGAASGMGMQKIGSMGGDVMAALPRFYDPMEYWDLSGLPWNMADEGHRHKLHKWLRLYYSTHYLIKQCVEIYSRFPLAGLSIQCKDRQLQGWYEQEFLDKLNYEELLYKIGREVFCALPGERVQTFDGVKSIEDVEVGDSVLTHMGRYRTVTRTLSKSYDGDYISIRPHYGLPLNYTLGHEILVKRDDIEEWIPVENVQTSDKLFVPVNKDVIDKDTISPWEHLNPEDWMSVVDPDEIHFDEVPDFISWTKSPKKYTSWRRREVRKHIADGRSVGTILRRNRLYSQASPLSGEFPLNHDLLRLFGLYVAEGCTSNGGNSKVKGKQDGDYNEVHFAFHEDETHLHAEVIETVQKYFGLKARIDASGDDKGVRVVVHNIPLAHWFKEMFGHLAENKRFPEWALHLPGNKTAVLLHGYFDGDGHQSDRRISAPTTSRTLASQVEHMIRRLGFVSRTQRAYFENPNAKMQYQVGPCDAQVREFAEITGLDKSTFLDGFREGAIFEPVLAEFTDNGYWVKVFKAEVKQHTGEVYDLTVEEDHSFVSSVAIHNCVGEAFPLGSFNESLGVWDREELLNPENIVIEKFPLMGTQQFKVHLPESIRRLAQSKSPPDEYKQLQINYEQLIPYALRGEPFPVSDVMLKHIATTHTDWDDHGTPILLGVLRTLMHEEKLMASQDAIAERLYSPLILAKLGTSEMIAGQQGWLPSPDQLDSFRDDMDIALSADFRLLVHHHALDIQNVFGREQVPDLGADFDRIERRIFQGFGINPSLLSAGSNSQPYASSALQAEFMNQQMKTHQNYLQRFFRERAMVVAEAQGHFDYEKRGGTRVPIMEEVVDYDDEGNPYITERHKLIDIELDFATMDMRDEATERQFLQSLRQMGVPIPDNKLMVGVAFDFKDALDEMGEEMVQKTLVQQRAKLTTYKGLQKQGLPIPADLKAEVESTNAPAMPGGDPSMGMGGGMGGPPPMPPGPSGGMGMPPELGPGGPGGSVPGGGPPAFGPGSSGAGDTIGVRPPISDERRPGMPKPVGASAGETFATLSPEEVDYRLAALNETIIELELQKRDRNIKTAANRTVVDPNEPELPWDKRREARIVIDKVPPAFRRNLG